MTSVPRSDSASEGYTGCTWEPLAICEPSEYQTAELSPFGAPLLNHEMLAGGFDPLALLGGLGPVIAGLVVSQYLAHRADLGDAADRFLTLPQSIVDRSVLDSLQIKDPAKRASVEAAFKALGVAGGNILRAIADAKAGL